MGVVEMRRVFRCLALAFAVAGTGAPASLWAASAEPVACRMDADDDVDLDDLRLASACLPDTNSGEPASSCSAADANGDGSVDGADLSICASLFFESHP